MVARPYSTVQIKLPYWWGVLFVSNVDNQGLLIKAETDTVVGATCTIVA